MHIMENRKIGSESMNIIDKIKERINNWKNKKEIKKLSDGEILTKIEEGEIAEKNIPKMVKEIEETDKQKKSI